MATPKAGEDAERLKPVRQRRRESQPPAERAPPERVSVSQRAAGTQGVGGGVAAAGPVRSQCPGTAPQCQDARTPLRIFPTRPRVESIAPGWDLQTCLLVLPNPTDSQEERMSVWPGDHEGRCSQTGASGSTTFLARLPRGWGPELRPRGLTGGLGICHRVTAPHFLCKCIVRQAPRVPVLQCLPCSTPESTARQILFS